MSKDRVPVKPLGKLDSSLKIAVNWVSAILGQSQICGINFQIRVCMQVSNIAKRRPSERGDSTDHR